MSTQKLYGYLRGIRGILITELDQDGSYLTGPDNSYWIDTAQQAEVTAEVVAGETADLRGGDRLLLRLEEDDVIVGVNLTFRDARFDAEATEIIAGGTLITADSIQAAAFGERVEVGDVIGWIAPTIEEQATRTPFQADVYVQSFDEYGGREAYMVYSFTYCRGRMPETSHSDRGWGTPEFEVKARQNSGLQLSTYQKLFVPSDALDALPNTPPVKVDLSSE